MKTTIYKSRGKSVILPSINTGLETKIASGFIGVSKRRAAKFLRNQIGGGKVGN